MTRNATQLNAAAEPDQQLAAVLLAGGVPTTEVAGQLGVDRTTIWRWRKQLPFQALLAEESRRLLESTRELARGARHAALRRLKSIVEDPNTRTVDQISAARAILSGTSAEVITEAEDVFFQPQVLSRTLLVGADELPLPRTPAERDDLARRLYRLLNVVAPKEPPRLPSSNGQ